MNSIKQNIAQNFQINKMEQMQNEPQRNLNSYDILNPFYKTTEMLEPKNHKYFKRNYFFEFQHFKGQFILDDFRQYSQFLNIEQNKLTCLLENHYHSNIFKPVCKILSYYEELLKQTQQIITKLIQRQQKINSLNKELEQKIPLQSNKARVCFKCNEDVMKIEFNKLKQQLCLYSFWDKYKFYKFDVINLQDMRRFKKELAGLAQSETEEYDTNHQFRDTSIGLQQFNEILNHLNSDLLIKNQAFQNGIIQMNNICSKVDEQIFIEKMQEKDIKYYENLSNNDQINNKMKLIILKCLDNYKKQKIKDQRHCQVQVLIKEYQGMKKLQKQKKELKLRLMKQQSERAKQKDEAQTNIASLNVQMELLNQKIQKIKNSSEDKFKQYEVKISELNKIIQILRNQIEQQNSKYAKLEIQTSMMLRSKRQLKNPSKKSTKKTTRFQQSQNQITSKQQFRTKNNLTNDQKNQSSNELKKYQSDGLIKSQQKLFQSLIKNKNNRKPSIMDRHTQGQSSFTDLNKLGYQKIDQKNEEYEAQVLTRSRRLSKSSRFRAIAGLNQPLTKRGIQTNNSIPGIEEYHNLRYKIQQKGERQKIKTQDNNRSQNLIQKLYLQEINRQSFKQISFQQFATSYQLFINQFTTNLKGKQIGSKKNIFKQNRDNRSTTKLSQLRTKSGIQFGQQSHKKENNYHIYGKIKQNKKKSLKLQPLSKKGQYYLHNNKQIFSEQHSPSTHQLSYQGIDQHYSIKDFQQKNIKRDQQKKQNEQNVQIEEISPKNDITIHIEQSRLLDLFGGYQNIQNYLQNIKKNEKIVINPFENQFIMNTMTLFVQLHMHDIKCYEYLKNIIVNPTHHFNSNKTNNIKQIADSSLRVGLKYIVLLHRNCKSINKSKQSEMCQHILNLKNIIYQLLDTPSKATTLTSINGSSKPPKKKQLKKKKSISVFKKRNFI